MMAVGPELEVVFAVMAPMTLGVSPALDEAYDAVIETITSDWDVSCQVPETRPCPETMYVPGVAKAWSTVAAVPTPEVLPSPKLNANWVGTSFEGWVMVKGIGVPVWDALKAESIPRSCSDEYFPHPVLFGGEQLVMVFVPDPDVLNATYAAAPTTTMTTTMTTAAVAIDRPRRLGRHRDSLVLLTSDIFSTKDRVASELGPSPLR